VSYKATRRKAGMRKKQFSNYFYNEILPENNEKLLEISVDGASLHGSVLKQGTVYCTV
jgi:hypothetical protein